MFEKNFIELTKLQKEYSSLEYIIKQLTDYAYLNLAYSNENLRSIDDIEDDLRKIIIKHYKDKLYDIKKEIDRFRIIKK